MPECNTQTFQIYLEEFSTHNPDEFKIIVLDNGAFHKAKTLHIPNNIGLIFLPPYSPELNPAENMWAQFKRSFTGKLHKSLDEISEFISKEIRTLTKESIETTCAFSYIFEGINWTI
jgi:transposase